MGGLNKNHLRLSLKRLKSVKTWQLFFIFILFIFLSLTCLRADHVKMVSLRSAVLKADEGGDADSLATALNDLQNFTTSHIVVNLTERNGEQYLEYGTGVFYLESSYRRAATAALDAVADQEIDDSNPNGNVYALASAVCRPKAIANGWTWDAPEHIDCYMTELAKYPADSLSDGTVTVDIPSTELYRREFASPLWTPTLSGFVLLLTFMLGIVIFIRFLIWLILEIAINFLKTA